MKPIAVTEEPNPHSSLNAVHVGTTNGDRNKEEAIVLTGESEAALIVVDDVVATRQPVVESNDSSDASDSILSPTVGGIAMMESSFIELDELIATTNIPSPTSTAVSRKRSVTQPNERTRSKGVTWGENGYDEGESSKEIHAIKRLKHSEGANAAEVDKSNEMLRTVRVEKATKRCRGTMRRDVPFSSRGMLKNRQIHRSCVVGKYTSPVRKYTGYGSRGSCVGVNHRQLAWFLKLSFVVYLLCFVCSK